METTEARRKVERLAARIRVDYRGCWIWTGKLNAKGYGQHRRAWNVMVGEIQAGLELDHLCRVRACVNPDHLEPVTHAVNVQRATGGRPNCANGHPFTEANIVRKPGSTTRFCRACKREWQAQYKARRRAGITPLPAGRPARVGVSA